MRKMWPGYTATYQSRNGGTLSIKSLTPPPETRKFKVAGGIRKFKKVDQSYQLQEVLIVARATKKSKSQVEVEDHELDDLESLDDLEDLEDLEDDDLEEDDEDTEEPEDEDEDEDEDDEDEDEPEPAPKKSRKATKAKSNGKGDASTLRPGRPLKEGFVGTSEVAQAAGIDSRRLRMLLRDKNIPVDPETGRYQWKSLNDPQVERILKLVESGAVKELTSKALDKVKKNQAAKKEAKAKDATAKTVKTKKKSKKVVEEDDE